MKNVMMVSVAMVVALTSVSIEAQNGKKPQVVSQPATAVFRCAVTDPADCPNTPSTLPVVPDGIRSDGLGAYAPPPGGTPSTTSGMWLDMSQEFSLILHGENGRSIRLDFATPLAPPTCGTACRKNFTSLTLNDVWMHTNMVNASGDTVDGGLTNIPVGGSSKARLKLTFEVIDNSGTLVGWAVRFNPDGFPGSDYVTVTRPAQNVWVVEATEFDRARLVSPGTRNHRGPLDEGTYAMPFRVVMTLP
jgi:hypothetical protein